MIGAPRGRGTESLRPSHNYPIASTGQRDNVHSKSRAMVLLLRNVWGNGQRHSSTCGSIYQHRSIHTYYTRSCGQHFKWLYSTSGQSSTPRVEFSTRSVRFSVSRGHPHQQQEFNNHDCFYYYNTQSFSFSFVCACAGFHGEHTRAHPYLLHSPP
jgi:hypothetical protein